MTAPDEWEARGLEEASFDPSQLIKENITANAEPAQAEAFLEFLEKGRSFPDSVWPQVAGKPPETASRQDIFDAAQAQFARTSARIPDAED